MRKDDRPDSSARGVEIISSSVLHGFGMSLTNVKRGLCVFKEELCLISPTLGPNGSQTRNSRIEDHTVLQGKIFTGKFFFFCDKLKALSLAVILMDSHVVNLV